MKYYVEEETRELKQAFDELVLSWPDVTSRKMMGSPSYMAKGKMFALMVTRGMVLTKLDMEGQKELSKVHEWQHFKAHKTVKKWTHLLAEVDDLPKLVPFIQKSYDKALSEAEG